MLRVRIWTQISASSPDAVGAASSPFLLSEGWMCNVLWLACLLAHGEILPDLPAQKAVLQLECTLIQSIDEISYFQHFPKKKKKKKGMGRKTLGQFSAPAS
jgi:hypothetical protein